MPTASIFLGCSDACGWVAAVVSIISFGSFGVPIKTKVKVEVHPLIMQSYKTIVCFLTSWLVILLGEEVRWTNWGIVSGMFWVPGAACGIYGIRNAGLAVAVGTWSSIMVMSSFLFGFILFQEQIKDFGQTCLAFLLLLLGLIGMSRYSAPPVKASLLRRTISNSSTDSAINISTNSQGYATTGMVPMEIEPLVVVTDTEDAIMDGHFEEKDTKDPSRKDRLVFFGGRLSMTRRQLGILGSVINGAWGGMNLIPLHFAQQEGLSGAGYLISYAGGALIVNTILWIVLFLYYYYQRKCHIQEALECLPKWHVEQLWVPGLAAGLLYSLGNFSSILAVTYLGQGTGFSFVQMQLFVSGLWAVFYFREIKGIEAIAKWFLSAFVAVTGIIWLSYEHVGGSIGHR